jgi:hypothetical protein
MNANLQKYLKYKAKYLDLKNELEGGKPSTELKQLYDELKILKAKRTDLNTKKLVIEQKILEIKDKIKTKDYELETIKKKPPHQQGGKRKLENDIRLLKEEVILKQEEMIELDNDIYDNDQKITDIERKAKLVADDEPTRNVFDVFKNIRKPDNAKYKEYENEKTSKSNVQDTEQLLKQIKDNIDTISVNFSDNEENTEYLLRILETTSDFVSKLTSAMDTQNYEEQQKSIKDYSDSEKEQNKIGNGLESLNKIMGDLSRLRDSEKTKEYNELLNRYSSIKQITNEYKRL